MSAPVLPRLSSHTLACGLPIIKYTVARCNHLHKRVFIGGPISVETSDDREFLFSAADESRNGKCPPDRQW